MTEPQREPGVYEAMQLQAATQRAMRDIYTERPDPLASIPAEAREALAAWLGLHAKPYEDIEEREIERVMEAMEDAWGHLPTLAAALRGVGDA